MHFELHRYVRRAIISEVQAFLDEHPFYSTTQEGKFTSSPTIVTERYNFEGRHFPIVIVTTTEAEEVRLAMDRLVDEVIGYARPTSMVSYLAVKVGDDPQYSGAYTDSTYLLETVNAGTENEENIQLKVTQTSPTIGVSKFYDMPEDGVNTTAITGVRIIFGAFNDKRAGQRLEIQTYANKRYLGDTYGSRFNMTVSLQVYAQTTNEAEELLDLITSQAVYLLPQRLYYGKHINVLKTHTSGIEKDGKLGEESFRGEVTMDLSVEYNMFIPFEILEGGTLSLNIQKDLTSLPAPGDINIPIAQWPPFTVQFDSQGGTPVAPTIEIPANTTIFLPIQPTKVGFTFKGWNTQANGQGTIFDATTIVISNMTVYAMWGS